MNSYTWLVTVTAFQDDDAILTATVRECDVARAVAASTPFAAEALHFCQHTGVGTPTRIVVEIRDTDSGPIPL